MFLDFRRKDLSFPPQSGTPLGGLSLVNGFSSAMTIGLPVFPRQGSLPQVSMQACHWPAPRGFCCNQHKTSRLLLDAVATLRTGIGFSRRCKMRM